VPTITYTPIPIYVFTASSSTVTSPAYLVQDYNTISVMVASSATNFGTNGPVIQASNDDGLQPIGGPYGTVAPLNWSNITSSISTTGVFSITPGMRWLRFGSIISASTVVLVGNAF